MRSTFVGRMLRPACAFLALLFPLSAVAAPAEAPVAPPPSASPLEPLELSLFVDAYAAWQTSGTGTVATLSRHRAFSGQGANLRAENGLSLAWVGLDATYDTGRFGAVVNLRLGQAASLFHYHAKAESDATYGVEYLTQAYVLYRPVPELELDLGMFLSPFGVESLESYENPNYTLSALYVYGQPSWHTGLKASYRLHDAWTFMAMVVNGSNNVSETQQQAGLHQTPTAGASVAYSAGEVASVSVGGLAALDPTRNDDDGFDVFADCNGTLRLGHFSGYLDGDFILTRGGAPSGRDRHFWGGSLTLAYRIVEAFGLAARGEVLWDQANYDGNDVWALIATTLTTDLRPVPKSSNLIVRWENRWERSNQRIFGQQSHGTADTADDTYGRAWFETVLVVVVTSSL